MDEDVTAAAPGPLAEEAARLVEAIGDWARGALGDANSAAAAPAPGAEPTHESNPSGHGGPECQVCPVCQMLALLRRTQPETFGHLAEASASVIAALRTFVDRHDHSAPRPSGVERIDLDGFGQTDGVS
jgi:hypothetical protein